MKFELEQPHCPALDSSAEATPTALPSFDPALSWDDALARQTTERLVKLARRFAAYHARYLGYADYDVAAYADDLVAQVLSDTATGVLRWRPQKRSLLVHVFDHIRQRARRDIELASRHPHHSIDAPSTATGSQILQEAESTLHEATAIATPETVARAEEVIAALLELEGNNATAPGENGEGRSTECARYLGALAAGATTKEEIMTLARFNERDYRNARRRVADLVAQLPLYLQPRRRGAKKGD